MAIEIKTKILINATPEKIWLILTNFEDYPNWNPFIQSIKGKVKVGNKITVRITPPGTKGNTFKPKVLAVEKNRKLSWLGRFLFAGIFDGEHKFELIDKGDGTTKFRQSEKFKGILVLFFRKKLNRNTRKGFEAMNKKLKELAERE